MGMTMEEIKKRQMKRPIVWVAMIDGVIIGAWSRCDKAMKAVEETFTDIEDEINWVPYNINNPGIGWRIDYTCGDKPHTFKHVVKRVVINGPATSYY